MNIVFIPLLAFDKKGNRLGYGAGFYDRFLSQCSDHTVKVGLLPDSTWQFITKYSPGEVAVRIQNAAVKNGANVTVNPRDNIVCDLYYITYCARYEL